MGGGISCRKEGQKNQCTVYSRLMIRCKIFCRRGRKLLAGAEVPGIPTRLAVGGLGPNVEGEAAPF